MLDVADHWVNAHLLRGQERLQAEQFAAALADFQTAKTIPDNLPSDVRRSGGRDAELAYLVGLACQGLGDPENAKQSWQEAAESPPPGEHGRGAGGFVARRAVQRYFRALAYRKLGQDDQATAIFRELVKVGSQGQPDPEAESAPPSGARQSARTRLAAVHYVAGLGHLGLGETEQATAEFKQALAASPDHLGASTSLRRLESER